MLALLSLAICSVALSKSDTWSNFTVAGRDVDAFVPACVNQDSPVILSLHAWATSKEMQTRVDQLFKYPGPECAVHVYPQGKARGYLFGATGFAWNAGGCCPNGNSDHVDDVSYLQMVITTAVSKFALNGLSVFVVGVSNGGMMANRLACTDSRVKAMVVVSGNLINGTRNPKTEYFTCSRKVPLLHFHGLSDKVVPFNGCSVTHGPMPCESLEFIGGGAFAPMQPVMQYISDWRARNEIAKEDGGVSLFKNNTAACTSWGESSSNITLCTLSEMGHSWPGMCSMETRMLPWILNCTMDMDASFHAMEFLRQYVPSPNSTTVVV
jgi:polyhydroxybutyrate depolymerase